MTINSKSIGNKIAEARKKNHLSQAQVAQFIPISPQAVGKWERGESLPDITTIHRLAELFGVDLNYFSDQVHTTSGDSTGTGRLDGDSAPSPLAVRKSLDWNWDMSRGNWADADFSGLKNLKETFSSSNIKNCTFHNSDLQGLLLEKNNIESCDFMQSDFRNTKFQLCNIVNTQFVKSSFVDAVYWKSNIEKCDFTEADFSGTEIRESSLETIRLERAKWKFTSFIKTGISHVVFEGRMEDCHFEHCSFYDVTFQDTTIINSFFKYNERFRKVRFVNCIADTISYAFLKNNMANMTGIELHHP